jgi:hypothetical protein
MVPSQVLVHDSARLECLDSTTLDASSLAFLPRSVCKLTTDFGPLYDGTMVTRLYFCCDSRLDHNVAVLWYLFKHDHEVARRTQIGQLPTVRPLEFARNQLVVSLSNDSLKVLANY